MSSFSCFFDALINNTNCKNKKCSYWYSNCEYQNCIINASNEKTLTLQEIGDIFNISRMRVCQIEKNIMGKLQKRSKKLSRKLMDKKSHSP